MCDLTGDKLSDTVPHEDVDLASLFFVLSAISPEKMKSVLENIYSVRIDASQCSKDVYIVCVY